MAEQIQYQQTIPAYSGITINITSPTLNAAPLNGYCTKPDFDTECSRTAQQSQTNSAPYPASEITPDGYYAQAEIAGQTPSYKNNKPAENQAPVTSNPQPTYPAEYYLNNYNVVDINNPNREITADEKQTGITDADVPLNDTTSEVITDNNDANNSQIQTEDNPNNAYNDLIQEENDLQTSQAIIENIETQDAEEKDLQKNGKQVKVVALTNEYIMSLENSLNNPNTDIRLMAAKDVLTRLDEDHDRYDDAALNALINKMLQDPAKLVRIAALSALSSNLASGNDYTIELLNRIQQDPNSDKQDVLEAAQIMLNRSATTEIRYIPTDNTQQQAN